MPKILYLSSSVFCLDACAWYGKLTDFIAIPMLFYIIVAVGQFDLGNLRQQGWLFDLGMGTGGHQSWYKFYSYLGEHGFTPALLMFKYVAAIDFNAVRFGPLWSTLPTQFALYAFHPIAVVLVLTSINIIGCFSIFCILPWMFPLWVCFLRVDLNVKHSMAPCTAVSLDLDVDTNKELVGHGYSNLLAGLFGTVYANHIFNHDKLSHFSRRPNYLVYVNTLL